MLFRNIFKHLTFNNRQIIDITVKRFLSNSEYDTANTAYNINNNNNYEKIKVTICGAAGKIGRLVSLFLKQSEYNLNISLYDLSPSVFELHKELKILNTRNTFEVNAGSMKLRKALKDSDIVTILIKSINYKTNQTNENFELNFPSVSSIAKTCIEVCPQAIIAIGTNPLNLMVPAICEIYKINNMPYRQKILGLTAFDQMVARSVYSQSYNLDSADVFVPITGGTTINTIVPIFSQALPSLHKKYMNENNEQLINSFLEYKIQSRNMYLSSALAISQFIESLVKGINGEKDIIECAYVATDTNLPSKYLISLIDLNEFGIVSVYGPPKIVNHHERQLITSCLNNLYQELQIIEKKKLQETKIQL